MEMEFTFPSGKQIQTNFQGVSMTIGGPSEGNGNALGFEPLDLFFASWGLCISKVIMDYCVTRELPYDDLKVMLETQWNEEKKLHTQLTFRVELPAGFSEQHEKTMYRLVEVCSVKKHIANPPELKFEASRRSA